MSYQAFSFTPQGESALLLNGTLLSTDDEGGARLASFEYLKRDGAEQEPMGAAAARFTFHIVLTGFAPLTQGGGNLSAGDRYARLWQIVRTQPRGIMVHPRLGRWQVAFKEIRGREEPKKANDTVDATLVFVEDQLDQAIAVDSTPTPQSQANRTINLYSLLVAASALKYKADPRAVMQAADRALNQLALKAASFVVEGMAMAQSSQADLTPLRTQLAAVDAARVASFAALDATLALTLDPPISLVRFRDQGYQIVATCLEMLRAIEAIKPPVIVFTVPSTQTLDQLLVSLYGGDASQHRAELLSLNLIPQPMKITAGTLLRLVSPGIVKT